jgi:hypothetical protein
VDNPINELVKALIAAQKEFAPLAKSAENPHFKNKFVPLNEVIESVLPVLNKNGLAVSQLPTTLDTGAPALTTTLMHESGQSLSSTMPLLVAKQDPQGQGSAITYARRYALMSILGLVGDEDDDGNAASSSPSSPKKKLSPLEEAKAKLRAAIAAAGLSKDEAAQYAWVATATETDIDNILGVAAALNSGKAVSGSGGQRSTVRRSKPGAQ